MGSPAAAPRGSTVGRNPKAVKTVPGLFICTGAAPRAERPGVGPSVRRELRPPTARQWRVGITRKLHGVIGDRTHVEKRHVQKSNLYRGATPVISLVGGSLAARESHS